MGYKVAVVGATGNVGREMLNILNERSFPVTEVVDLFRELHASDPTTARRLARAAAEMPVAGSSFLGFHLDAELGRGAFARVFLARQLSLASRAVVLKISANLMGESRMLAQLQHTTPSTGTLLFSSATETALPRLPPWNS